MAGALALSIAGVSVNSWAIVKDDATDNTVMSLGPFFVEVEGGDARTILSECVRVRVRVRAPRRCVRFMRRPRPVVDIRSQTLSQRADACVGAVKRHMVCRDIARDQESPRKCKEWDLVQSARTFNILLVITSGFSFILLGHFTGGCFAKANVFAYITRLSAGEFAVARASVSSSASPSRRCLRVLSAVPCCRVCGGVCLVF
jgi:hypothetical protein